MAWINDDGLRVRFATEEAELTHIGEFGDFDPGSIHLVQLELSAESLPAVAKKIHTSVRIPGSNGKTAYLKKAEIFVETAFTGGGNLTIGFDNVDGTVFSANGVDAAVAYTAMTAGVTIACDGTLVNTRLANTQALYVTTTVGTAIPATGKGWLRLWYYLSNE